MNELTPIINYDALEIDFDHQSTHTIPDTQK